MRIIFKKQAKKGLTSSVTKGLLASTLIFASSILSTSCNLYTTDLTGRYTEIVTPHSDNEQPVYSLDLFRYGRFVQAVLRFTDKNPLSTKDAKTTSHCIWTEPNELHKNTFHLTFKNNDHQGSIDGQFSDDGKIFLTIQQNSPIDKPIHRILEKSAQPPEQKCITDRHIPIAVDLSTIHLRNEGKEISPNIATQFSVIWVGTRKNFDSGIARLENKIQLSEPYIDLTSKTEASDSLNKNPLRMYWPAPIDPSTYTPNGSTSFTIGYPVVLQTNLEAEPGTLPEKIIASTMFWNQKATNLTYPHTGYGRAILYVDGNLKSLAPSTQKRISVLDNDGKRYSVEHAPNPNSHMYVCDIYFTKDTITHIDILNAPLLRTFSMHQEQKQSLDDFKKAPILF